MSFDDFLLVLIYVQRSVMELEQVKEVGVRMGMFIQQLKGVDEYN